MSAKKPKSSLLSLAARGIEATVEQAKSKQRDIDKVGRLERENARLRESREKLKAKPSSLGRLRQENDQLRAEARQAKVQLDEAAALRTQAAALQAKLRKENERLTAALQSRKREALELVSLRMQNKNFEREVAKLRACGPRNQRCLQEFEALTKRNKALERSAMLLALERQVKEPARLLRERELEARISDVFKQANALLIVVSPYVKLATALRVQVQAAKDRGVRSTLICRADNGPGTDVLDDANTLFSQIYRVPHLHAKAYINQDRAIVASLNLYDFSSQNLEMGIAIAGKTVLYEDVLEAVREYQALGELYVPGTRSTWEGSCIACASAIERNPHRPLCMACWRRWKESGRDTGQAGSRCHCCGTAASVSFAQPVCSACR